MAKCNLTIDLDDPDAVYQAGDVVRGKVHVDVDANVACKGLVLTSSWRTHGRGNVDSKEAAQITVFQGEWRTGDQLEYPFELKVADWPPSYHGFYLNVDHYIDARAKIAWAFDPKASTAFQVRCDQTPEDPASLGLTDGKLPLWGLILLLAFLGVLELLFFIGTMQFHPLLGFTLGLTPLLGIGGWLFFKWLPGYALGEVECSIETTQLCRGETLTGELVIRNRRPVNINGIQLEVRGKEQCVSGSGSNQTTHTKEFFKEDLIIEDPKTLEPGVEHRFPIEFAIPGKAPYSMVLGANSVIWDASVRIDIPRWPDWVKRNRLHLVPSESDAEGTSKNQTTTSSAAATGDPGASSSGTGITFAETAKHLWDVRDDDEQREMLVEAVTEMTFDFSAIIERRLLYSGDDAHQVFKNGHAVWARFSDPGLPLTIYVPHDLGDEFEQVNGQNWSGRGTVLGWDDQHGRLLIKLEHG